MKSELNISNLNRNNDPATNILDVDEDLDDLTIAERVKMLDNKCVEIDQFIKKTSELTRFKVKVADSCPLAKEMKNKQKAVKRKQQNTMSEQEKEQNRINHQKKQ